MFNRQPMGFAPRQSRFSGGLGGLFGGMGGGFNPYQQQMPMMGGFNPYMGGGFNPYMGGGFNPYMRGGFNPYMGGGFSPMMRGGFEGYDFDSPIGEAPPGVEPTPPPPPPSISDLYGGLDEAQRNAFLEQYGLSPTTTTPPALPDRSNYDSAGEFREELDIYRDQYMPPKGFDSGSAPGEPRMGTMGGPVYDDAGNLIGNLGTAGPTFPPGVLGPIGGGQRPIPPQDFGFGPGIRPTEIIGPDGSFVGSGSVTPPDDRATAIPQPDPVFNIPGIDLEKIRESLAKMEPIIPGISLPEPIRISEPAPTPRPIPTPRPMPVKGPQPYKNIPIKAQPPVNVPMPEPMPSPVIPSPIIPGPLPRVISDPVMPKPAPITRGIGGVRGGMRGRRR
jgi:hypothetical protein